ncbi:hypothetical protein AVEN_51986-1 [Araneus ventricosus]|uniref:C2H2-type domain-containing protein n=1 Tax=Araneus ventricosus TaxID=182803 RepID=A0A4Y2CG67_ARAVE|nr:hypothetical protein AVEN_51986-1 [Araneus ventricosus]
MFQSQICLICHWWEATCGGSPLARKNTATARMDRTPQMKTNFVPSLPVPAIESKLSSKPLPQHSQSFTSETPFSILMPSLSVPAATSELSSAFSIPLPYHSQCPSILQSVFSMQMFNIEVSNPFGVLESLSELENPVDNLLKVMSTQKNGGGAISKVCQESFPSYYLYKKHTNSSSCSLSLPMSGKVTYPRKCDTCLCTFSTKSSFSNHKHSCIEKSKLSDVINDSCSITNNSPSIKLALSFPVYACKICFKTFSSKFSLNCHEKCSSPAEPL